MHDPLYQAQLKQSREGEGESLQNPGSKLFHFAAALLSLKKFLGGFTDQSQLQAISLNKQKTFEDLEAFKTILEELSSEDKSHDPEYTQRLSLLWQNLFENCKDMDETSANQNSLASKIYRFVGEIKHFPPGEDEIHTLGYYLAEHAGQDWIPFPFMSLLADLYQEAQTSPSTSQLNSWVTKIGEIIASER